MSLFIWEEHLKFRQCWNSVQTHLCTKKNCINSKTWFLFPYRYTAWIFSSQMLLWFSNYRRWFGSVNFVVGLKISSNFIHYPLYRQSFLRGPSYYVFYWRMEYSSGTFRAVPELGYATKSWLEMEGNLVYIYLGCWTQSNAGEYLMLVFWERRLNNGMAYSSGTFRAIPDFLGYATKSGLEMEEKSPIYKFRLLNPISCRRIFDVGILRETFK